MNHQLRAVISLLMLNAQCISTPSVDLSLILNRRIITTTTRYKLKTSKIPSTLRTIFPSRGWTRTTRPPCCRDMLGSTTCHRLLRNNEHLFGMRCNKEAEFRLLQCCTTCNRFGGAIAYDLVARSLVSEQCNDRYGPRFCDRYVNSTDVWSPMHWSCDGQNPQIAFRTCRQSCGFCDFEHVHYTLANALDSCKADREFWIKVKGRKRPFITSRGYRGRG